MNNKIKHMIRTFLAVVLLVSVFFSSQGVDYLLGWICHIDYPYVVEAAETGNQTTTGDQYVSEFKIYESDSSGIKSQISKDGYQFVDQDMNEGAGGKYTYLAYKTTNRKEEAATDLKILAQDSGYTVLNYMELIDENYTNLQPMAEQLYVACMEYSNQFNAGSPMALFANKMLNIYKWVGPDGEEEPFGDFLADKEALKVSDLFRFITRASSTMVNAAYTYIAMGVANDPELEGKYVWYRKLQDHGMFTYEKKEDDDILAQEVEANLSEDSEEAGSSMEEKEFWNQLDYRYEQSARDLRDSLITYTEQTQEALDYLKEHGGKIQYEDDGKVDTDDLNSVLDSLKDCYERIKGKEELPEDLKAKAYASSIAIYEAFNRSDFSCPVYGSKKLGEYLLALGADLKETKDSSDEINSLRNAYPLIDSLTKGQYAMARTVGILSLSNSFANTDDCMDEGYHQYEMILDALEEEGITDHISVWATTQIDVYREQVAQTSNSSRQEQAGIEMNYDTRNDLEKFDDKVNQIMKWVEIASAFVTVIEFAVTIPTMIVATNFTSLIAVSWTALKLGFTAGMATSALLGTCGCIIAGLGYIGMIVSIVYMLYQAITGIIRLFYHPEPKPVYNKEDMPRIIYDVHDVKGKPTNILYKAAYNQNGEVGDINGFSQSKWDILFYSNNPDVGSPIKADSLGQVFKVLKNNEMELKPKGYEPLTMFGIDSVFDLNAENSDADTHLYFYYRTEDSIQKEDEPEPEPGPDGDEEYLSDLVVFFCLWESRSQFKAQVRKNGYSIIEQDLSPDVRDYFARQDEWWRDEKDFYCTYLAYKTTKDPKKALRDIRVEPYVASATAIHYGSSSYTLCGIPSRKEGNSSYFGGILGSGAGLYETMVPQDSPPILADFKITDEVIPWDNEDGWIPISCFTNGNPYDFYRGGVYNPSANHNDIAVSSSFSPNNHRYVYFRKNHNYNKDADRKKYLAGISFVGGYSQDYADYSSGDKQYKTAHIEDYIAFLGAEDSGQDICEAAPGEAKSSYKQKIALSYTYDPYRAVSDIATFESQNGTNTPIIVRGGTEGYITCETYLQSTADRLNLWKCDNGFYVDEVRGIVPTHRFLPIYRDGGDLNNIEKGGGNMGEFMYVRGYVKDKKPIEADQIYFSEDPEPKKENGVNYVGVNSIAAPYRTEPYNLRAKRSEKHPLYMFVAKDIPKKGKYVSGIYIGVGKGDDAIINAISQSNDGELIPINLADDGNYHDIIPNNISDFDYQNYNANKSAYMCVEYSDKTTAALTSLVKVKSKDNKLKKEIKIKGKTYKPLSPQIPSASGNWYLYGYGISSEAHFSTFDLSTNIFEPGMKTTPSVSYDPDNTEQTVKTEIDEFTTSSNEKIFLHFNEPENWPYFDALYVASGKSRQEALANLLNRGAGNVIDYNLNMNAGGDYVYMGYTKSSNKKTSTKIADIILTKDVPYASKYNEILKRDYMEIDGVIYYSAGKTNLNAGTNGAEIYMYYAPSSRKITLKPYLSLYAGLGDSIPVEFTKEYLQGNAIDGKTDRIKDFTNVSDSDVVHLYERVLDQDGKICDLNSGLYGTYQGEEIESRIYLYGARENKQVKENPNAQTFEKDGDTIHLFGLSGLEESFGEYKLK